MASDLSKRKALQYLHKTERFRQHANVDAALCRYFYDAMRHED